MKKKTPYIGIGIVAVVIIFFIFRGGADTGTLFSGTDTGTDSSSEVQEGAPRFTLSDYSGAEVSSKDFKGKLLVLNAWASWCPFCVDELPDFVALQKAFPEDIVIIAINRAEPPRSAKNFTDSLGISNELVFLVDPKDSFYKSVGGFSMPETLFITEDGEVKLHKRGPFKFPEMKEIIERILAEE